MSRLLALLLLATMALAAPAFAGPMALFDNFHGEQAGNADWIIDDQQPVPVPPQSGIGPATARTYWTGAISSFGVDLVKRGYTVHTNATALTYGNAGNPYDLSNYDVLIVPEPNWYFTAAEATAILTFVQNGGGLIAISDHGLSDRNSDGIDSPMVWNALDPTHQLGVHFQVGTTGGATAEANNNIVQTSTNVNAAASDSVTHGPVGTVTGLAFHNGTTFTLYPGVNPTVRGEVWMTGTSQSSLTGVMAASSQYGSGRVFFIGDSSPVDDGSATSGNSSIYDGWGEAGATDSTLFMNATLWASRRTVTGDTQAPTVTVTSPAGGETWKANSSHAITWTATDNVGVTAVDIAYSTDGGATYPNSIATGLSNSGSYAWSVPNAPSTTVRVRVTARDAASNSGTGASAANFTIDRWTITASAGANGGIAPSGAVAVVNGGNQSFTITPAANYHVADVLVDGGSVGAVTSYGFTNVTANHTIAASFAIDTRTITASAGANGSITPSGTVTLSYGGSQAFTIATAPGYHVADVLVDGGSVGAVAAYSFNNVTANHTIAASFAQNAWSISTSVVGGGSVIVSPQQASYPEGASVQLTAVPSAGFAFTGWSGDATGSDNPLQVTVTGALSYTAAFADTALPVVALLAPVGNDSWIYGTTQAITWSATDNAGVTSVNIDYSTTGADGPWLNVATGAPNTGSYDWTVPAPATPTAVVRVTAFDAAGNASPDSSTTVFAIIDPSAGVAHGPAVLALARPTPNPSGNLASIAFSLPRDGHARIEVLDAGGRRVASVDGAFGAGQHVWQWDGRLASGARVRAGLYFVRLTTPFGDRLQRLVRLD